MIWLSQVSVVTRLASWPPSLRSSQTTPHKALLITTSRPHAGTQSAWHGLADLFMRDLYRLHSLTPESLLTVYLQVGVGVCVGGSVACAR